MGYGTRVRDLRLARRLGVAELAERAGLSRVFVGQIEAERANPSVGSLTRIAEALDVPMRVLFDERVSAGDALAPPPGLPRTIDTALVAEVVRRGKHKPMWSHGGRRERLLTPNVQRLLEVTLEDAEPVENVELRPHPSEELGYILEGTYEVLIADQRIVLEAGDSIYLNASIPHAARVIGDAPGRAIWVSTPPSF